MLLEIALVIGLPFVAGVTIARLWPRAAACPQGRRAGLVRAAAAIIVIWRHQQLGHLPDYITLVLLAVFLQHAMALLLGYGIARATGCRPAAARR